MQKFEDRFYINQLQQKDLFQWEPMSTSIEPNNQEMTGETTSGLALLE